MSATTARVDRWRERILYVQPANIAKNYADVFKNKKVQVYKISEDD